MFFESEKKCIFVENKKPMKSNIKRATTLDEQLELLTNRGVLIENKDKAKECLLDIGYYRLGSYLFPFEKTYPNVNNRNHQVVKGTKFSDAVRLYYFDFDLRIILIRYITRIEISLRTYITYFLSNNYNESVTWFADPAVVTNAFIKEFDLQYKEIAKRPTIKRHHKNILMISMLLLGRRLNICLLDVLRLYIKT